jgi:DNA-binding transcriptional MerR regulator
MDKFSISQLGQYSGVRPHTIRAWETRYKAFRPGRSKGNTRQYDGKQLRRLLNIVSLMEAGYKISELGVLPDERLFGLLEARYPDAGNETDAFYVSQLISAGMDFDEARFERVFSHCLVRYRLKGLYLRVLLPMIDRIGLLWKCNKTSPAHEHFISNLLRQKFFTAIDGALAPGAGAKKWLLFLPENEFHELGLLFAHSLIRLSGQQSVYLGASVPWEALQTAIGAIRPDHLMVFLVNNDHPKTIRKYLLGLDNFFTGSRIHIAGNAHLLGQMRTNKRIVWLRTVDDLAGILSMG